MNYADMPGTTELLAILAICCLLAFAVWTARNWLR